MTDEPEPSDDAADATPTSPARGLLPEVRSERVGLAVVVAIGLVMVGFVLGRVTAPEGDTQPPEASASGVQFPAGDQDRSGYWGYAGIRPVVTDAFDREDSSSLGTADTGQAWQSVAGSWSIDDGTATVSGSGDRLVVIGGGPSDRLTEATLTTVQPGAGIAFRYGSPRDYWAMVADEGLESFSVQKVVDGDPSVAATVPVAAIDGVTISVAQRGAELQVLVDGQEAIRVTDQALMGQSRSGLLAAEDTPGEARWDRFYVGAITATG